MNGRVKSSVVVENVQDSASQSENMSGFDVPADYGVVKMVRVKVNGWRYSDLVSHHSNY